MLLILFYFIVFINLYSFGKVGFSKEFFLAPNEGASNHIWITASVSRIEENLL